MRKIICIILLLSVNLSCIHAQRPFDDYIPPRPNIKPVVAAGITTLSVGVVSMALGGLVYFANGQASGNGSSTASQDNTAPVLLGVGAGLLLTGTVLCTLGTPKSKKKKLSVLAPKRNEIGIAYNF